MTDGHEREPATTFRGVRWTGVCLDCADAEELATFYRRLLGLEEAARDGSDWILMRHPDGGATLSFQAEPWYEPPVWPEVPGTQTKMLHLEVLVDDVESAVEYAVSCGASVAGHQPQDRDPSALRVMLDPAGHPFCLCTD
jgi:catechol 2,3-dioxygenase-like lactoylglutathione lyase family enzyme